MVRKLGGQDDKYAGSELRGQGNQITDHWRVKLHILSDRSLQIALLRKSNFAQVRHGHRYQDEQFEDSLASDIR